MKKNRFLFLIVFALFVFIPVNVLAATEISKMNYIVDEPEEGETPDLKADVIASNEDGKVTLTIEDVDVNWIEYEDEITLTETDRFEDGKKYWFQPTDSADEIILEEIEKAGYTLAESGNSYINGLELTFGPIFVVNGIEEFNVLIETLYVGETLPTSIKAEYITNDGEFETTITEIEWYEVTEDGNKPISSDTKIESGKKYYPELTTSQEITNKFDNRTIIKLNGEELVELEMTHLSPVDPMDDVNTIYELFTEVEKALEGNDSKALIEAVSEMTKKIEIYNDLTEKQMDLLAEKLELEDGEEAFTYVLDKWVDANTIVSALEAIDTYVANPTKENATALVEYIDSYKEMYEDTKDIERYYSNLNKIYSEAVNKKTESEPEEENPKTFDGIGSSIFMGTISLIGLVGATIYLKKKNKVRA